MPRVRLLKRMAGPEGNYGIGQIIDVSAERAEALVAGGFAEMVDAPAPALETATRKAPEKATAKRQKRAAPAASPSRRRKKMTVEDEK